MLLRTSSSSTSISTPYRALRVTKDGRRIEVWVTATPLINPAGIVTRSASYAPRTIETLSSPGVQA